MHARGKTALLTGLCGVLSLNSACTGGAGSDGSEILFPYEGLSGGMVFATREINGAAGYDLWWVPVPLNATVSPQPVARLTDAQGDEWQPSVSKDGNAIAFVRKDKGIFLINNSGRVSQISDTGGTDFKDSLPALSADGSRVAWVREDFSKPIGDTGFVETFIMMANFDGTEARPLNAKSGVLQDAPTFDPAVGASRVAWSEFNVQTLGPQGPNDYGIWIHNYETATGRFICQSPPIVIEGVAYRCFGQHLVWPIDQAIILPQQFLELFDTGNPPSSIYPRVIESISTQQLGIAETQVGNPGFFGAFPMSASYQDRNRLLFDGLVSSVDGDLPTLGFFVADVDGGGLWRLNIQGYFNDYDPTATANFLFSVATPQLIP